MTDPYSSINLDKSFNILEAPRTRVKGFIRERERHGEIISAFFSAENRGMPDKGENGSCL
jgi:hypothetical protein